MIIKNSDSSPYGPACWVFQHIALHRGQTGRPRTDRFLTSSKMFNGVTWCKTTSRWRQVLGPPIGSGSTTKRITANVIHIVSEKWGEWRNRNNASNCKRSVPYNPHKTTWLLSLQYSIVPQFVVCTTIFQSSKTRWSSFVWFMPQLSVLLRPVPLR